MAKTEIGKKSSGVETCHPDYTRYAKFWRRCRDVIGGSDEVKAREEVYLPRLNGHGASDYKRYLDGSVFYNVTGKTADALHGMIFRKEPAAQFEEDMSDVLLHLKLLKS